jgi:hypothetical protein
MNTGSKSSFEILTRNCLSLCHRFRYVLGCNTFLVVKSLDFFEGVPLILKIISTVLSAVFWTNVIGTTSTALGLRARGWKFETQKKKKKNLHSGLPSWLLGNHTAVLQKARSCEESFDLPQRGNHDSMRSGILIRYMHILKHGKARPYIRDYSCWSAYAIYEIERYMHFALRTSVYLLFAATLLLFMVSWDPATLAMCQDSISGYLPIVTL